MTQVWQKEGMRSSRSVLLASFALASAVLYACSSDELASSETPQTSTADASTDGNPVNVLGPSQDDDATAPDAATETVDGAVDAGTDDAGDAGDAGDAAVPVIDIYDQATIPRFDITLDADAIKVFSTPMGADDKTWVKGTFDCGGTILKDVGFRRKGSSTFRSYPNKMALKVKFNKYVDGQTCFGLKELTWNNSVSDPTFLAERLSYAVFRAAGVSAQRANSADVYINGTYWGLYLNVETPNKDFIKRLYGKKASSLYEAEWGSPWNPDEDIDGYDVDEGDGTDLKAMFTTVTAAKPATLLADVAPVLDTTELLKFSATEGIVGHYDGYGFGIYGDSHNYYLAGNTDGVFSLIPWSTDLTFSDREAKTAAPVVNVTVPKNNDPKPSLLMRCKASTTCWPSYIAQVNAVLGVYESMDLVTLAKSWNAQIDGHVRRDTKTDNSVDYYEDETATLYKWIAARPAVVRAQIK